MQTILKALTALLICSILMSCGAPKYQKLDPTTLKGAQKREVKVLAKGSWRDSGIKVRQGQKYELEATGRWRIGATCPFVGPSGIGQGTLICWDLGGTVSGWGAAALIAKIGKDGLPFGVGEQLDLNADRDGRLYFRINDPLQGDNEGRVNVTVQRHIERTRTDIAGAASRSKQDRAGTPEALADFAGDFSSTWRAPKKTRLLSVGISRFKDSAIPTVSYAARDAGYLASFLSSSGVPEENITCLTNNEASRSDILNSLMRLKMATTEESETAVFYFSGHGAPVLKDGKIVDAALVPYDATESGIEYSGIKVSTLKDMLSDTSGNWIVILDACFSGKEGRSLMAKNVKSIAVVPDDFTVTPEEASATHWLTSTSGDSFANAFPKKEHGLFTYYLVQALNGEEGVDANEDGLITLREAFDWTEDQVASVSAKSLGRPQDPELSGQGNLILTVPQ